MGLLGRQPEIVAFTAVETAGLGAWLALARGTVTVDPVAVDGVVVPAGTLGLGVLFVALVVEHLLTDATVNGVRLRVPLATTLAVSATETALWALWLAVAAAVGGLVGVGVAGAALAVLLVPQHTVEDNGLRGEGLLSDLLDVGTVGFSLVEAAGATIWLALVVRGSLLERAGVDALLGGVGVAVPLDPALVGLGALAAFLLLEHNLGVGFARRGSDARAPARRGEHSLGP